MNEQLTKLQEKIKGLKGEKTVSSQGGMQGYNIAITMITDLISCVFVGLAIGIFLQKFFATSVLLTAILTLLGGMAGLWNVIRFALNQEKGNKK